jgi:hypothetical protein
LNKQTFIGKKMGNKGTIIKTHRSRAPVPPLPVWGPGKNSWRRTMLAVVLGLGGVRRGWITKVKEQGKKKY